MAGNEYLDKTGLGVLWERMKQYVYECCCSQHVTYTLESNGSTISLVGSDGTRSTITVTATASCTSETVTNGEITPIVSK